MLIFFFIIDKTKPSNLNLQIVYCNWKIYLSVVNKHIDLMYMNIYGQMCIETCGSLSIKEVHAGHSVILGL